MERSLTFTGIHQNTIPTFQQSVQYMALMTKPQWLLHVSGFLRTALDTYYEIQDEPNASKEEAK